MSCFSSNVYKTIPFKVVWHRCTCLYQPTIYEKFGFINDKLICARDRIPERIDRSQKSWSIVVAAPSLLQWTNIRLGYFHRSMDKENACPSPTLSWMVLGHPRRRRAHINSRERVEQVHRGDKRLLKYMQLNYSLFHIINLLRMRFIYFKLTLDKKKLNKRPADSRVFADTRDPKSSKEAKTEES